MQTEETQMQQAFEKAQADANDLENSNTEEMESAASNDEEAPSQENQEETAEETSSFDVKEILTENNQLRAQITSMEEKHKSEVERLVRVVAETENQKKRIEADIERERKFGNEKLLKALIPVVDSLELALQHSDREDPALKPTVEGIENTTTLLLKELKNFGVEQLNPVNEAFDPNLHQAISMAPSADVPANNVVSVMQKGYTLNGRVVRPAMVIVSNGAPASAAAKNFVSDDEETKNTINIEA